MRSKIKIILEGQARLHGFKKYRSYWIRPREGSVDCLYFDRGTRGGEYFYIDVAIHFPHLPNGQLPDRAYQLQVRTRVECFKSEGRLKYIDSLDADKDMSDEEREQVLAEAFSDSIMPFFDRLSSFDHLRANWEEERRGYTLTASPGFLEALANPPV